MLEECLKQQTVQLLVISSFHMVREVRFKASPQVSTWGWRSENVPSFNHGPVTWKLSKGSEMLLFSCAFGPTCDEELFEPCERFGFWVRKLLGLTEAFSANITIFLLFTKFGSFVEQKHPRWEVFTSFFFFNHASLLHLSFSCFLLNTF